MIAITGHQSQALIDGILNGLGDAMGGFHGHFWVPLASLEGFFVNDDALGPLGFPHNWIIEIIIEKQKNLGSSLV